MIADTRARCASALVQVGVGSLHEPDAWPGLAHLLEHVLFAGSEAFQDDERLMMWVQAQGGRLNATTLGDRTAFFFESSPLLLADGLARLTDMLVAPLLAESAIRQETAAIDAEYRLLCGHQDTLTDAALSAAFASHPWQRFQVGDGVHLGTDAAALRSALLRFHQRAYHAANVTLWLQGPQTEEELWRLAERAGLRFNAAPQVLMPQLPPLVLSAQRDYRLLRTDGERLRLSFLLQHGFSEEITLLRQLLLDEAEGSLMAALRAEGLCDELRVLRPYISAQQQVLSIELTLPAPQFAAIAEGLLHHWLHRLAKLSDEQLRHSAALAVRQFSQLAVMDRLRERAFGFAPPEAWPLRWQPLLAQLVAKNLTRLRSGAWETECSQLSHDRPLSGDGRQSALRQPDCAWLTGHRRVQGFHLALSAQRLDNALLPSVMPVLDFFPRPLPTSGAETVSSAAVRLPHDRPDDAQAVLLLSPALVLPSPWGQIMQAALRALAGSCAHGGGELRLESHQGLWLIQLSASPELMITTLASLMARLAALPAAAVEQGERAYQRQQRSLRGDIAVRTLIAALPPLWQNVTYSLSGSPLPAASWQASLYGGSRELHRQLARQLAQFPGAINPPGRWGRPLPLPPSESCVDTDSDDAAVVLFCPLTDMTPQAAAARRCLTLIFQPAFFQQLRVEQNMGYAVSCRDWQVAGHSGILFCLQSPTLSHDELWQAIEAFLQRMTAVLAAMTTEQLAAYRQVLLGSLANSHSDPLIASREHWLRQQDPAPVLTAEAVDTLSLADLYASHQQILHQRRHQWRVSNRSDCTG